MTTTSKPEGNIVIDVLSGILIALPIGVVINTTMYTHPNAFEAEWRCGEHTMASSQPEKCVVDHDQKVVRRINSDTEKVVQHYRYIK